MTNDRSTIEGDPTAPVVSIPRPSRRRVDSIDLLRGIVMVIMMLDHTRDFMHRDFLQGIDPLDLSKTDVFVFFTRWITHYCAPIFVFLAGTAICLQLHRGKSKSELSRFLLTRGFWLIVLEFTVVRFGFLFNFDYRFLGAAQVIWVIGLSMIFMAALIHLPWKIVTAFGVLMIFLHNLLDGYRVVGWRGPESPVPGLWAKLWIILHQPNEPLPIAGFPSPVAFVVYPLIPWLGVMAAGFGFGALYKINEERRRRLLIWMGLIVTTLFIVLRFINIYGDPSGWSKQDTIAFTILSFLNTTKYPPSLLFLLMTLGPAMLALAWFGKNQPSLNSLRGRIREVFVTFGRVPLFFYILQWYAAHLLSVLFHYVAGKPVRWMFNSEAFITGPPAGVGFNLLFVYAAWIIGVILLYPLCKWFAGLKARRRDWWLSYL